MESFENGSSKKDHAKAKKIPKRAVFTAKRKALDDKFSNKDDAALFCWKTKARVSVKNEWKMMITSWPTLIQQKKNVAWQWMLGPKDGWCLKSPTKQTCYDPLDMQSKGQEWNTIR